MDGLTNRVYLPDGNTVHISDDGYGQERLEALYAELGDLKVEICQKEFGRSLSESQVLVTTTLRRMVVDDDDDEIATEDAPSK